MTNNRDSYTILALRANPFVPLPPDSDYATTFRPLFSAREKEVAELCRHARQPQAVFVIAPYGGGKSVVVLESLVRLADLGFLTFYGRYKRRFGFRGTALEQMNAGGDRQSSTIETVGHELRQIRKAGNRVVIAVDDLDRAAHRAEVKDVTDEVRELLGGGAAVVITGQPFGVTADLNSSAGGIFHRVEVPEFSFEDFREMLCKYLASVHTLSGLLPNHPFSEKAAGFICDEAAAAKLTPRLFNFAVTELLEFAIERGSTEIPVDAVHGDWPHIADRVVRSLNDLQLRHLEVLLDAGVVSEDSEDVMVNLGGSLLAEFVDIRQDVLLPLIEKNLIRARNFRGKEQYGLTWHAQAAVTNLRKHEDQDQVPPVVQSGPGFEVDALTPVPKQAEERTTTNKPMITAEIPADRRDLQKIAGCENGQRALDIVFIHGLGGDSWTTWMADKEDIEKFWPNWLAQEFPQVGLWTLGYAASGSKWKEESMPLADRGNQVLDLLANDGIGERPVVFITHSMGGIVAKQILRHAESFGVSRWEAIAQRTRGLAFIATPHSGAHIANFAELASAVYRTNEQVLELVAHDPRLRELHGWFLNYLRKHGVVCRTYCEKRELRPEIPLLGIKLPKGVLVVDETSAEPNIPGERAIPLDEDHISICKPATREAQLYKGVVRFLKECVKGDRRPL